MAPHTVIFDHPGYLLCWSDATVVGYANEAAAPKVHMNKIHLSIVSKIFLERKYQAGLLTSASRWSLFAAEQPLVGVHRRSARSRAAPLLAGFMIGHIRIRIRDAPVVELHARRVQAGRQRPVLDQRRLQLLFRVRGVPLAADEGPGGHVEYRKVSSLDLPRNEI